MKKKKKKTVHYPNLTSAIRLILHSVGLLVANPPKYYEIKVKNKICVIEEELNIAFHIP